jgi:LPS-assembly protein
MNNVYKGKAKSISASMMAAFLALVTIVNAGKLHHRKEFYKILTTDTIPSQKKDTIISRKIKSSSPIIRQTRPAIKDTIPVTDTTLKKLQTDSVIAVSDTGIYQRIDTFDIKISKDTLSAPVYYHADDSVVVDVPNNKIMLYGKTSSAKYENNNLTAPGIVFDQKRNRMYAYIKKDSTGKVISYPTYKSDDFLSQSDTIEVNIKNGKGITKGTYTQQGEMYVYGERIKKIDASVFFAYRSRITTCNLDTPHFAFVSKKIKFINDKFAVTGPVHPEFEGVPIPLYLPFGIYPMYSGRHSGLMAPSFTSTDQFGIAMQDLGYYKVFNDVWDVTTRGTFYSYGGWTLRVNPRYYKRYRYQGNLSIDIQHTKFAFKGDPDFKVENSFKIRWSHNADTKSRPGVTFGANVEAGTSKFNQNVVGNPNVNYRNQLQSSINYSKVWKDKPFNMAVSINHDQNSNTGSYNLQFPNFNFNVNTIYPFRRKEAVGSLKWYENIGVALNTQASNKTTFNDTDSIVAVKPVGKQIIDNMLWGVSHNVPISLSLPPLGPLQISPGVSYSERWYQQKALISWNDTKKKKDTLINKGFYTARDMAFSLGMSTRIFGMFTFGKNSSVKAIRHEIRPQLSVSYKPDFNKGSYYTTQIDTFGRTASYSYYGINNVYGAYGSGKFAGLSFGLDNNIQMKVKDKKDTSADATKKVTLIDGLSITGSYNFLAPRFKLSNFNLSARTNLFNKVSISASAVINPYLYDTATGADIDRLVWKEKTFTLGRLTGGNISLSTSFQGGEKDTKKRNDQLRTGVNPITGMPLTEDQEEAAYISNNPAEYTDFSLPWSVQFGLSVRFSQKYNDIKNVFKTTFGSDLNLSGSLALTEKWQLGLSTFYNFSGQGLGMVSLSIAREMHCWQMAISVSPVGRNKFFSINISPKSALLRDIKVNRSKYFFD